MGATSQWSSWFYLDPWRFPCPVEEDSAGMAGWAGGPSGAGEESDNPVRSTAAPAQAVTDLRVLWRSSTATPPGDPSCHHHPALGCLSHWLCRRHWGYRGQISYTEMPVWQEIIAFHCSATLSRALWQTVAPFSFLTTILVWMSWSQVSLCICIVQSPLYNYTVTTWGRNLYSLSITVLFALPFLSHTWCQLKIPYWKRECSPSLASSWQYLLQVASICLSYKISY